MDVSPLLLYIRAFLSFCSFLVALQMYRLSYRFVGALFFAFGLFIQCVIRFLMVLDYALDPFITETLLTVFGVVQFLGFYYFMRALKDVWKQYNLSKKN